jgi:threonine/homoserine/homoserine lactone efflux protein
VIDTGRLLAFAVTAFAVIVTPGPSMLFVLSRAVAWGRKAAVATAVGNEAGLLVQVGAIALGVGAIVERSLLVFTVLKVLGAGYLIYLGVRALRSRRHPDDGRLDQLPAAATPARVVGQGFVVGVTNPKTAVFFTAVLPEFVNRSTGPVPIQLLLLGTVFVLIALVCDSAWGLAAGTARQWFARSPRRLQLLGGAGGLVMIGLGIDLVASGRKRG